MYRALAQDTRSLHALVRPGRRATFWSLARLWAVSPSLWLLASHRMAHHCTGPQPRALNDRLSFAAAKILAVITEWPTVVATKSHIAPGTPFEPGVVISDRGYVIAGARFVGSGTVIGERTTIGMNLRPELKPWIGRNVWIGSHCVVYGGIRVGDGATILPRTILTRSVPDGCVVEGNPARLVGVDSDHSALRRRHFSFGRDARTPDGAEEC